MTESAGDKVADLKRQMGDAGSIDPIADRVTDAAVAATNTAQDYAGELADAIRRQPFAALAIGMTAAYVLGRLMTSVRR